MSEWFFFQNLIGENSEDISSYGDMSSSVRFRTLLKARAAKVCLLCRAKVTAGDASAYVFFPTSLPHLTASYRFLPHPTLFYRILPIRGPLSDCRTDNDRITIGQRADMRGRKGVRRYKKQGRLKSRPYPFFVGVLLIQQPQRQLLQQQPQRQRECQRESLRRSPQRGECP